MKTIINILFGSTLLLGFSQCGSSKEAPYNFQTKVPFTIEKAIYQDWEAGVKGRGGGTNVILTIENIDSKKIEIDKLFYKNQKVKIEVGQSSYVGRFISDKNRGRDFVLHSDPKKEYGNEAPREVEKTPFALEINEAVISYKEKGKTKYYKIKLEKGEAIYYP